MAMDRRRGVSKRPASSEEIDCWSRAASSLATLSNRSDADLVGRVNRHIMAWGSGEMPGQGMETAKANYNLLRTGLAEVQAAAERDAKAMEDAIERIGVLIALRNASEATPPEKRAKRPRAHSPTGASTPSSSTSAPAAAPAGAPPPIPFSRDPKARREALAKQLPLERGRMVAFHPPPNGSKGGDVAAGDADDNTWIMAKITKCINMDKNRYEVQDVEPQEDGEPGAKFNTTLRAIIPLPDLEATPGSASHLSAYQEFASGSTVLALYPDTSCFYRAEVLASPRDLQPPGRNPPSSKVLPKYKLKFEDDDDQEHTVSAQWVVEWPGQ
ncbi:hypothetical protein FA95DRAFT_1537721 [Auriscalpium vulgare]|uniref:Uncharacterized protein n=1 Tax=Auriscalpium vulgare TaxID=40419 RepID=A0ACB8S0T8_9AGAM|nr:hypothetical protein FA95DRAFT_1537721 [Auriscalpium vulgare]